MGFFPDFNGMLCDLNGDLNRVLRKVSLILWDVNGDCNSDFNGQMLLVFLFKGFCVFFCNGI